MFVTSLDVTLCDCLGLKHQMINELKQTNKRLNFCNMFHLYLQQLMLLMVMCSKQGHDG